MMIRTRLPRLFGSLFQFSTSNSNRLQMIRNHTPRTQYSDLNPLVLDHTKNSVRLIQDQQTKIKFLVEEGGFPGCTDFGICLKLGTKDQDNTNAGSLQCLKNYVHMKPTFDEMVQYYQFLQQTGSTFDFNYDSLTSYAKCSFFQQDKGVMIDLLLDLVLQEKNMFQDNIEMVSQLNNIPELVRRTAFGDKGIGMPSAGLGNILTNKNFINFQQKITPHNMLISMSNMKHPDEAIQTILQKIKKRYPKCTSFFKAVLSRNPPPQVQSQYCGGTRQFESDGEFFEFAVAYPSVPYQSQHMELYNILRILLGSASSFSSGGPGKGMHSRCTKHLLNRVACVEKASFINEHYEDTGLFGLTVGGPHQTPSDVIDCTIKQLDKLKKLIPQQELSRSKNMLISSINMNIQRQSDRLEEMSKHIYSYGKVRLNQFEAKIRQVTSQQVQNVLTQMFKRKPTVVLSGNRESLQKARKHKINL